MTITINLPPHLQDHIVQDSELAASFAELARGEAQVLTPELREEIRADAMRNLRNGHVVRRDVTY